MLRKDICSKDIEIFSTVLFALYKELINIYLNSMIECYINSLAIYFKLISKNRQHNCYLQLLKRHLQDCHCTSLEEDTF